MPYLPMYSRLGDIASCHYFMNGNEYPSADHSELRAFHAVYELYSLRVKGKSCSERYFNQMLRVERSPRTDRI